MSDLKYGISVEFTQGIQALRKFQKAAKSFDKGRESALKTQIALLQKMKNLQAQVNKPLTHSTKPLPKTPIQPSNPTFVGPQIDKNTQNFLKKQAKERAMLEARVAKEKAKQVRLSQTEAKSLEKAKKAVMNTALMTELEASHAQKAAQAGIKRKIAMAKTADEVRKIVAQERASLRLAKKKSFLVQRMEASSKEFAGNMVSAFAVAAGGVFITQTGQNFEAAGNTMLSVSENAKEAGENMQFVKEEAFRLGLGLTQATKGFAKLAAARGEISLEDTKELFLGVSEASTLLGLTAEESNRALLAIQQMASKGKISAEELRLQLGEVLPQGIQLMANAAYEAGITTDNTVASMSKMMEEGKLMSADVLPEFAKQLRNAAQANGGLEKALQSNRVAMNQMITAAQASADTVFKSGWGEGLTELFKTIGQVLMDNELLFTEFGKTMGKVFKGVAWLIENLVAPAFSALGSILHAVNSAMDSFGDWVALALVPLAKFSPILGRIVKHFGGLKGVMKGIMFIAKRLFMPFILGLGVLEEIAEFFSPTGKKTFLRFNVNDFKSPFESWLKDVKEIANTVSSIFGMNGTSKQIQPDGNVTTPYGMRQLYQVPTQTGYPAITVKTELNVDGEKMAESVSKSPTMKEAVNRQVNNTFKYNH